MRSLSTENTQVASAAPQLKQEFDTGAFVVVTNIPGPVHPRYLHLDQHQSYIDEEGRHVVRFGAIAAGSDANARYHEVVKSLNNVEWVREGGVCITLTEIDEATVDVSFNRWAKCESELHAGKLSIHWAQFACQWAQAITSSKLFTS
ncbi:hypothetical protein PHYSODRAFT_301341 [Phytophthora sojae]|uniref:Uncharacterized protein n=1 Tax=Phytophthora sojae (strain P6497) TaxID=1094619 RepID=G4ZJJ5_PHYSP|nr:hypothetical protein PHYSODRAFT_301341 [Phytophthora sojae]EGZ18860.1 hypothetical protein PHYSODRAFT_301341 [Phytophthora sojae]|eukprot:XP_009527918.1 hypothetical protein PHYSODRAFT_301341 [Phytophthora sojae]